MPFIAWINEIFNEQNAPYTMAEIITRLQSLYSPSISRSACYRALHALEKCAETAEMVKPLDGSDPHSYTAEGARRIGRRVTQCKPPDRLFEPVPKPPKTPQNRPQKDFETQMGRKRNRSGTAPQKRLAA